MANKAHKHCVKCQYNLLLCPRVFSKYDHVLVYDQDKYPSRSGKFKPMWFRSFIIKIFFEKGSYDLVDCEGNALLKPINGIYLKKYYA
jgi:hypothetical protein